MNRVSAIASRIARRGTIGLLTVSLVTVAALVLQGAPVADSKGTGSGGASGAEAAEVEVRLRDNSLIKLKLQTETITLATRYGKLTIPAGEIGKIEFATRVPEAVTRRVEAAIKALGSKEFKQREQAAEELKRIGVPALAALKTAAEAEDAEVKHAAEELITGIKDGVPEEMLVIRDHDIVHTKDSRITGTIETNVLRASALAFGEVQVKLADLRVLRSPTFVDAEPDARAGAGFLPPGGVMALANQIGRKVSFTLTGAATGAVWGTGVYTIDSDLSTAAVHAGILKVGQTGVVTVQVVAAPQIFNPSVQNGIQSVPWAGGGGAYQFIKRR